MVLTIGVAAAFFGVVFLIVGWKGGGVSNMNQNLTGMVKGNYLPANNPQTTTVSTSKPTVQGATSTTGGSNASGSK